MGILEGGQRRPDRTPWGDPRVRPPPGVAREPAMKTTTVTTFEVSDIVRANQPLPEVPYKQAVEALLTTRLPEHHRRMVEDTAKRGFSIPLPEVPPYRPVEACTRYHGRLLADMVFHPVVAAVHRAFMDHRPLRLSPDATWLMICQALATHLTPPPPDLRPRLLHHTGPI